MLTQAWVSDSREVLSGLFNFENPQYLMKCIIEAKNDFIQSVQNYSYQYPISCLKLGGWLDFGHLNSFFSSRTAMTTQRVFNDLEIKERQLTKKSKDLVKMQAESNWFEALPRTLAIYAPPLIEPYKKNGEYGLYSIEYMYLLPLSDLFVFGNHSVDTWKEIFLSAKKLLNEFHYRRNQVKESIDIKGFDALYLEKTLDRLSSYKAERNINIDNLVNLATESSKYIDSATPKFCSIVHGDFCFSNLLYDSRTHSLKLIDPRGLGPNHKPTLLGDVRYDVAKFYHSAVGCYDLIIAGRYKLTTDGIIFYDEDKLKLIEDAFDEVFFKNNQLFDKRQLLAINVHLFLSMLPLHNDRADRQNAMIANAEKLFIKLKEMDAS